MIRSPNATTRSHRPAGFTLVEVMLVGALMSFLVMLISGTWTGVGRSVVNAIARCRVTQEANLATESLSRDFSGSLAEQATGRRQLGSMVGCQPFAGPELRLCYDGEPLDGAADWGTPDTVIAYTVENNCLVRSNLQAGTEFVAAGNVEQMQLTQLDGVVTIDLTFKYRNIVQTYTFEAKGP